MFLHRQTPTTSAATRLLTWGLLVGCGLQACGGCRAIHRFGDSRQTIAARRLSRQGLKAMHDGQWSTAETLFTDALDISRSDDRAHWGLAEALWQRGERDVALVHMEKATRLSAGDPRLVQRLGRMYLEAGRLHDADQQCQAALRIDRRSAEAWALRGDCLKAAGSPEQALAAYHRALALRPDYPAVQLQAAEIYFAQGRHDRLLATLDPLDDDHQDQCPPRANLLRGFAMRELGRPTEAVRYFARAAAQSPDDPAPHLQLAALAIERQDITTARQHLATALRLDPESINPLTLAGNAATPQDAPPTPSSRIAEIDAGVVPLNPTTAQPRHRSTSPPLNR